MFRRWRSDGQQQACKNPPFPELCGPGRLEKMQEQLPTSRAIQMNLLVGSHRGVGRGGDAGSFCPWRVWHIPEEPGRSLWAARLRRFPGTGAFLERPQGRGLRLLQCWAPKPCLSQCICL